MITLWCGKYLGLLKCMICDFCYLGRVVELYYVLRVMHGYIYFLDVVQ